MIQICIKERAPTPVRYMKPQIDAGLDRLFDGSFGVEAMVVALRSGLTIRFEIGDDDPFTADMSLLTTRSARSPGLSTTIHAHIRGTLFQTH